MVRVSTSLGSGTPPSSCTDAGTSSAGRARAGSRTGPRRAGTARESGVAFAGAVAIPMLAVPTPGRWNSRAHQLAQRRAVRRVSRQRQQRRQRLAGRRVALLLARRQHLAHERLDRRLHLALGADQRQRRDIAAHDLADDLDLVVAVEQRPAGEDLPQRDPHRELVGAVVDRLAVQLLGRRVRELAADGPGLRAACCAPATWRCRSPTA